MIDVVSLCSGIGLIDLGLEWAGFNTVQLCEIDPWCRRILHRRFPGIPIHDDVRTVQPCHCDLLAAGFPCQPFSVAGKQKGTDDDRWLWPSIARAIKLSQPKYVLLENVPNITRLGLDAVLKDLAALRYDAEWGCYSAAQIGALHKRERWWCVAVRDRTVSEAWDSDGGFFRDDWATDALHHADTIRRSEGLADRPQDWFARSGQLVWAGDDPNGSHPPTRSPTQPAMGRVADGLPPELDRRNRYPHDWGTDVVPKVHEHTATDDIRIAALGNGVVPQNVCLIGHRIQQFERRFPDTKRKD